jgi:hypothetical protein
MSTSHVTVHKNAANDPPHLLVVLCHGFQGSHNDFVRLVPTLASTFSNKSIFVITTMSNEGWPGPWHPTRQGTLPCATRAYNEILTIINGHKEATQLNSVVVLGHSFGGIYSRAMLKLMKDDNVIPARLFPLMYISMASPHLGVRWRPSLLTSVWQFGASVVAGRTGAELLLEDNDTTLLTIASGEYLNALKLFQSHVCYGNVQNDLQVPLCTASIRSRNPYRTRMTQIEVPDSNYPSIVALREEEMKGNEENEENKVTSDKEMIKPFSGNQCGDTIRTIHDNLNTIDWIRIDCICGIDCHSQIIGNHPFFQSKGIDVITHLSNSILQNSNARAETTQLKLNKSRRFNLQTET